MQKNAKNTNDFCDFFHLCTLSSPFLNMYFITILLPISLYFLEYPLFFTNTYYHELVISSFFLTPPIEKPSYRSKIKLFPKQNFILKERKFWQRQTSFHFSRLAGEQLVLLFCLLNRKRRNRDSVFLKRKTSII